MPISNVRTKSRDTTLFNAAVTANEDPLAEGAIGQVKQFVHEFLQYAKK